MKWLAAPALALAVLLAAVGAQTAADRAWRVHRVSKPRALPLIENALPYRGYGEVDIVEDGALVIQLNGEVSIVPATGDVKVEPEESLVYRVDPTDLQLVESDGVYFLDRHGLELEARGLKWTDVSRIPFVTDHKETEGGTPVALLSLVGELELDYDVANDVLMVSIVDIRQGYKVFSLEAPIRRPTSVNEDSRQPVVGDRDAEAPIVLKGNEQGVSCTADCQGGECSISCDDTYIAMCYCKSDGTPVCRCTPGEQ
jgi:hypothetical protein